MQKNKYFAAEDHSPSSLDEGRGGRPSAIRLTSRKLAISLMESQWRQHHHRTQQHLRQQHLQQRRQCSSASDLERLASSGGGGGGGGGDGAGTDESKIGHEASGRNGALTGADGNDIDEDGNDNDVDSALQRRFYQSRAKQQQQQQQQQQHDYDYYDDNHDDHDEEEVRRHYYLEWDQDGRFSSVSSSSSSSLSSWSPTAASAPLSGPASGPAAPFVFDPSEDTRLMLLRRFADAGHIPLSARVSYRLAAFRRSASTLLEDFSSRRASFAREVGAVVFVWFFVVSVEHYTPDQDINSAIFNVIFEVRG
jgi:hypothetical protein